MADTIVLSTDEIIVILRNTAAQINETVNAITRCTESNREEIGKRVLAETDRFRALTALYMQQKFPKPKKLKKAQKKARKRDR